MGRKIPGRKHHGVRDPEKQRLERLKKIKDKINAPPTNPDEQQVSKSLQRFAELKEKAKTGEFKRKKRKKTVPKVFPGGFEQRPNETDRDFLLRVHKEVDIVKREAAFEQKFGVEIKKNEKGEVEAVKKRPKDPVQVMVKEARQEKKKRKLGKKEEIRLTKSQKRHLKLVEKKKKRLGNKVDEFQKFQDTVKFGEQVHAPPTLTLPKKATQTDSTSRPGQRNLLLKAMLQNKKHNDNTVVDRKGKRKDLPNALRRQLDKQQQEVIEAYRLLKRKKHETT